MKQLTNPNRHYAWVLFKWTVILLAVLALVSVVGASVKPVTGAGTDCSADAQSLTQLHFNCQAASIPEWIVRLVTFIVLVGGVMMLVSELLGYKNVGEFIGQMLSPDSNDSPADLAIGLMIAMGYLTFEKVAFTTWVNFLLNIGFQLPVWWITGLVAAITLVAIFTRTRSFEEFHIQVWRAHVQAVPRWAAAGFVLAAFMF